MTVTLTGPGGRVEIANEEGDPIDVTIVGAVDLDTTGIATEVTLADAAGSLVSLLAAVDGLEGSTDGIETLLGALATQTTLAAVLSAVAGLEGNTTGLATQSTLASVLAAVDGLEVLAAGLGLEATQQLVLAKLEAIRAAVVATGPLTDAQLRASAVPVSGTVYAGVLNWPDTQPVSAVDLDIRNLTTVSDSVRAVDAAETAGLLRAPFTVTATGTATLVAAPGVGNGRLRLRRLSPTYAIRSPDSEPILALFVGAAEAQRGNALTGRFDIPATNETDAITLTVDVLDAGGQITGTAYYSLEA